MQLSCLKSPPVSPAFPATASARGAIQMNEAVRAVGLPCTHNSCFLLSLDSFIVTGKVIGPCLHCLHFLSHVISVSFSLPLMSSFPMWSVLLVMTLAGTTIASDVTAPPREPAPRRCLTSTDLQGYWETVYQSLRGDVDEWCGAKKSAVDSALRRLDSASGSMWLVIVVIVVSVTGIVGVTLHRFQSFEVMIVDEPVTIARSGDVVLRETEPPPNYEEATARRPRRGPRETSL